MRRLAIAAAASMGLWSSGANALTGNQLHDFCKGDRGECDFYVMGVLDTNKFWEPSFPTVRHCAPTGATISQAISIVKKYLRDEPGKLHESASGIHGDSYLFGLKSSNY